ncbi:MAG TPA: PQQ-dependent sugar dehydrogenase [Thermoanaerobaculia bacterium]|nr:PQQ-dependent sugar dehydrogenase [Thermoanaerobaculia bacterium]
MRPLRLPIPFLLLLSTISLTACWSILPSKGGGQTSFDGTRQVDPSGIALPDGYRAEVVATGLTFPTAVAFDDRGGVYVLEAGYSYGEVWTTPRLLRVEPGGRTAVVATGENPPWNGTVFQGGAFYIADGGEKSGGRILRVTPEGAIRPIVEGLPSVGDHHTNGPAVGPDGWIYFGQGTATNSGVVGTDNYEFGWLKRHPDFHDVPCRDVRLSGRNYTSDNPLTSEPGDRATTGAFLPFGTASTAGQVISGKVPCSGAVLRVRAEGGTPELVAWGFRNPFGLAFSPDGKLYLTENGFDQRGSRPVYGTPDVLWAVEPGRWYGWPDHSAGVPLKDGRFAQGGNPNPEMLLADMPGEPPEPAALLGVHASANGFDFSRSESFGYVGEAFVAHFGDMAPKVGKVLGPVGFKVSRVNVETGRIEDFAVNRPDKGPASMVGGGGLERPVAARFDPSGEALYVVDFGVMTVSRQGPSPKKETGVLWRITRTSGSRSAERRPR